MNRLLIATGNAGKQIEFKELLAGIPFEICTPEDIGLNLDVEETGSNYAENAILKAKAYSAASGLLSLADDTGLEVEALDGAPGLYSARFTGSHSASDAERRSHLLAQLKGKPRPWRARFCCAAAVASTDGRVESRWGECAGEIIPETRGVNGFGYDPIFLMNGTDLTMAEISTEAKNRISHRARAVNALRSYLESLK
jgi:XTP/dITP diphosphohydrolase